MSRNVKVRSYARSCAQKNHEGVEIRPTPTPTRVTPPRENPYRSSLVISTCISDIQVQLRQVINRDVTGERQYDQSQPQLSIPACDITYRSPVWTIAVI